MTFKSGSDIEHHVYVGPRLVDVLALASPQFDPSIKNDKLRHFVDTEGPRLVVPGDIAGGRYVTNVNRVFLQKPPL